MDAEEFLWNDDYAKLGKFDGYFIVGGFSYEDRSRSGIIAAQDPLMNEIRRQAETGKPILGVCNGAQILVETGLVPGLTGYKVAMALAANKRSRNKSILGTGFYNTWVNIKLCTKNKSSAFTTFCKFAGRIKIPIAHGEGRFVIPPDLLSEMIQKNLTLFQYCDEQGNISEDFPTNPNGAVHNLAAVGNAQGNIMAMMPHPERSQAGLPIFTSMRNYIAQNRKLHIQTINYEPKDSPIEPYQAQTESIEMAVDLIITDNEAVSVAAALQDRGIDVSIKKQAHWEIELEFGADAESVRQKIIESGELFNSNKEKIAPLKSTTAEDTASFLVRYKDDFVGENKKQTLARKFSVSGIKSIKKGVLWHVESGHGSIKNPIKDVLNTHILYNQYSQTCFLYPRPKNAGKGNNKHMDYTKIIQKNLKNTITRTDLAIGRKITGKVRDRYELDGRVVLITTDRQSAFDRVLAAIPFKGQVLNQTSAWWFKKTQHIIPNHVIEVPDPNVTIGKKCEIFPVEFVVRGYITGTTGTSAWINYQKGVRDFCGNDLPEGLKKNQKFTHPIITPTTKNDKHDRVISPREIIAEGLMSQADWNYASQKALELFAFGQKVASEHGLILVDTKYEMGKDKAGNIILADEIHTPDSSRYWIASSYEQKFSRSEEPENIDKEFLRLWFKEHCDPYNDPALPEAPDELVAELSRRYIMLYEMITGEPFEFPDDMDINARIKTNLTAMSLRSDLDYSAISHSVIARENTPDRQPAGRHDGNPDDSMKGDGIASSSPSASLRATSRNDDKKAILILGSDKDLDHAQKITDKLNEYDIANETHVASAHKNPLKVLEILENNKNAKKLVYITIAGRSNALSGFVAANSDFPTIACPPFADKIDMLVNIHSTLQMPSEVPVMTVLDPGNAALAAKRILDNCHCEE